MNHKNNWMLIIYDKGEQRVATDLGTFFGAAVMWGTFSTQPIAEALN